LSNVLRDRPSPQVPVNLNCGCQRYGRSQWMDDRSGQQTRQRLIFPERKRANQRWQMSALMAESSYTHISHAVRPLLLFLSGRKKYAENFLHLLILHFQRIARTQNTSKLNKVSAKCQALSDLSKGMWQPAIRAT